MTHVWDTQLYSFVPCNNCNILCFPSVYYPHDILSILHIIKITFNGISSVFLLLFTLVKTYAKSAKKYVIGICLSL